MNSQMTDFAFAGKCPGRLARGLIGSLPDVAPRLLRQNRRQGQRPEPRARSGGGNPGGMAKARWGEAIRWGCSGMMRSQGKKVDR